MMSTAEEARALVSYAKFPTPKDKQVPGGIVGVRGAGSPFAPAVFGQSLGDYIATANKNTFIAVQIETVLGLENCEEIAKVDGIGEYIFSFLFRYLTDSYGYRYVICRVIHLIYAACNYTELSSVPTTSRLQWVTHRWNILTSPRFRKLSNECSQPPRLLASTQGCFAPLRNRFKLALNKDVC